MLQHVGHRVVVVARRITLAFLICIFLVCFFVICSFRLPDLQQGHWLLLSDFSPLCVNFVRLCVSEGVTTRSSSRHGGGGGGRTQDDPRRLIEPTGSKLGSAVPMKS